MAGNAPDLLSVVLSLRPVQRAESLPHVGTAAQAIMLQALQRHDAALATEAHSESGPRPYTVSGLIGYSRRVGVDPQRTYALRMTALTSQTVQALSSAAGPGGDLAAGSDITLAEQEFSIESAATSAEEHPWAAATSYEHLSAPWLLGHEQPPARVELHFASPTTFKSDGLHVPVPLPGLTFGSLLDRWNAFAPVALPAEARRFAEKCLAMSRYNLRSRAVRIMQGSVRIGAAGRARYSAINRDRYWLCVVNLLADFALFSGVGAGTTMGLGQARRYSEP